MAPSLANKWGIKNHLQKIAGGFFYVFAKF